MKLQYGNTQWGSEWLKALEEADHANRLPRGCMHEAARSFPCTVRGRR